MLCYYAYHISNSLTIAQDMLCNCCFLCYDFYELSFGIFANSLCSSAADSSDPASVVQNFLQSLQGNANYQQEAAEKPFTTLADLLTPTSTLPLVESADTNALNNLLSFLPPSLLLLAQNTDGPSVAEINPNDAEKIVASLSSEEKRDILRKVLRSPQFSQSLGSLTMALRDGGLPSISEALQISVENGGFMRRGGVPLGGGDAVRAFLEGVKRQVLEKGSREDTMETD